MGVWALGRRPQVLSFPWGRRLDAPGRCGPMSCRPESGRQRALGSPPRGSGREVAPGLVSISGRPGGGARLGPLQPGCCHRGPHLAGGWAGAVSLSGEASSAPAILSIGAGRLGRCPAVKCAGGGLAVATAPGTPVPQACHLRHLCPRSVKLQKTRVGQESGRVGAANSSCEGAACGGSAARDAPGGCPGLSVHPSWLLQTQVSDSCPRVPIRLETGAERGGGGAFCWLPWHQSARFPLPTSSAPPERGCSPLAPSRDARLSTVFQRRQRVSRSELPPPPSTPGSG